MLVVVAVVGPFIALFVISCTSTKQCQIGDALRAVRASCSEGSGTRSQVLLHGETCSVVCSDLTLVATPSMLVCDDGTPIGLSSLQCVPPPSAVASLVPAANVTSFVPGAITRGLISSACVQAQKLPCTAESSGMAVMVRLTATQLECDNAFTQCTQLNPRFAFEEYTTSQVMLASLANPSDMLLAQQAKDNPGTCTLGCFGAPPPSALIPPGAPLTSGLAPPLELPTNDDAKCRVGYGCINISGSCNAVDNGDYYRLPSCALGFPQWATRNLTRRLRYDPRTETSQFGKWVLEGSVPGQQDNFGQEIGRQPAFALLPNTAQEKWYIGCTRQVSPDSSVTIYGQVMMQAVPCTCTDIGDCNGHGKASGQKDEGYVGANCTCTCDPGWGGLSCDIPLCQVPGVLNGKIPACKEGAYLLPGQSCTPDCMTGFAPNYPEFRCADDGSRIITPSIFTCTSAESGFGEIGESAGLASTTKKMCAAVDCGFRGDPTGAMYPNGTCVCQCHAGATGPDCRIILGDCQAPVQSEIANSEIQPCLEGGFVSYRCTAQCQPGYFPSPSYLSCDTKSLTPSKFVCLSSSTQKQSLCNGMRYITIAVSCLSGVITLGLCLLWGRRKLRRAKAFVVVDLPVDVEKDEYGDFNVLRVAGKIESKLPDRIDPFSIGGFVKEDDLFALEDYRPQQQIEDSRSQQVAFIDDEIEDVGVPQLLGREPTKEVSKSEYFEDVTKGSAPSKGWSVRVPDLRKGTQALIQGLHTKPELNNRVGWLLEFDHGTGRWLVDLGADFGLKRVPEYHLFDVGSNTTAALAVCAVTSDQGLQQQLAQLQLPGSLAPVDLGSNEPDADWLMSLRDLEREREAAIKEHEERMQSEERRKEAERRAELTALLESTTEERAQVEASIRDGMRRGDAEAMRPAVNRGLELLERLQGVYAGPLAGLQRVVEAAKTRLEQYDDLQARKREKFEHAERVRTGKASDWNMTAEQFWDHVASAHLPQMQAGLKARMSVLTRSKDRQRLTMMHVACIGAVEDSADQQRAAERMAVVQELLKAKAGANSVDNKDRTPLDLALESLGNDQDTEDHPTIKVLRTLGFLTAAEAAAVARGDSKAPC